jgi:hypothetical protein
MLADRFELACERWEPPIERRSEIRHGVDLVCVIRRRHWRFTRARVADLSADGMLVSFEGWIGVGVGLDVSFKVGQPAIWFDTHATVTRVVQGRRAQDSGHAMGLRFESLSAVSHLILGGQLRYLPRPPSRREPRQRQPLDAKSEDYAGVVRSILEEGPAPWAV